MSERYIVLTSEYSFTIFNEYSDVTYIYLTLMIITTELIEFHLLYEVNNEIYVTIGKL